MQDKITHLISDADGVLINSKAFAWKNAEKVIRLFADVESFESQMDFEKHFGRAAQIDLVGEDEAEILRGLHRLLMRHTCLDHGIFSDVVNLYRGLKLKKTIVSSAYAAGISQILGDEVKHFDNILGREQGTKLAILRSLCIGEEVYVTDSTRDIKKCKEVGLPVIAVGWGYGTPTDLLAFEPDHFAADAAELRKIFELIGVN